MCTIVNMLGVLTAIWKMSNKSLLAAGFVLFSILNTSAQLARTPLSADEIRKFMFGTTMSGEYASGQTWSERFNSDDTSQYVEDGKLFVGEMTLKGNILCFSYNATADVSGGCFEVWKRGPNCFDFYSKNTDSPSANLDQKRFGRGWDARAWYADQQSTCLSEEIS